MKIKTSYPKRVRERLKAFKRREQILKQVREFRSKLNK